MKKKMSQASPARTCPRGPTFAPATTAARFCSDSYLNQPN